MFILRFILILMLIGCSDSVLMKVQDRKPNILVHPEMINFGNLISGQETGEKYFSIINTGDDDLYVTSPELFDGSTRFEIDQQPDEILIASGELVDINVYSSLYIDPYANWML